MRKAAVICCAAALVMVSALAGSIDEPLRATLLQMARDDQESIRLSAANPERELTQAETTRISEMIRKNGELIRGIVQAHGWPGRSLVGDDGASAAWLVVQHMDYDTDFQRSCLDLMQEAFAAGEVRPRDFAYLTDRVLSHEGKRQMYGTQGSGVTSPADEARVDANRAAIGLPPWRIAVAQRQKDYANGHGGDGAKQP
jgi:hypothetical protein